VSADWDISPRAEGENEAGFWSGRGRGRDRLAVVAYLRGAHGFLVDTTEGREVGVVDNVSIDHATGAVVAIEVRGGWFGRRYRVVDVADVVDVFPESRRLIVVPAVAQDGS
jgi:sporulation protein YlmC with PRC-barrel domain